MLDGAFADLCALGVELASEEGWFPRLLAGLLSATLREYQHLEAGLRQSTPMVAWACRNLLDLHIYTRYALASEANALRVFGERLRDGIETYDSFQTWLARNDPERITPGLDEASHAFLEQLADSGLDQTPPLKLKRVAAEVGLADEHANMSRLSQALAHPNAFSIFAGGEAEQIAPMKPMLFRAGAGHGLEIFQAVREYVSEFGLRAGHIVEH